MLLYQPKEGSIVYCDFSGYVLPEIIKKRPVVVIHKHRTNGRLVTVVPISKTCPHPLLHYHHELDSSFRNNNLGPDPCWCKCDLIYVVSIDRLDRMKNPITKKRGIPVMPSQMLTLVKKMVRIANGL